jgi:hypothetical protein
VKSFLFSLPYRRPRKERGGDLRRLFYLFEHEAFDFSFVGVVQILFARVLFFGRKQRRRVLIHGEQR